MYMRVNLPPPDSRKNITSRLGFRRCLNSSAVTLHLTLQHTPIFTRHNLGTSRMLWNATPGIVASGLFFRIQMVDWFNKVIYPFKRPISLLEDGQFPNKNLMGEVKVIFGGRWRLYFSGVSLSWQHSDSRTSGSIYLE